MVYLLRIELEEDLEKTVVVIIEQDALHVGLLLELDQPIDVFFQGFDLLQLIVVHDHPEWRPIYFL